MHNHQIFISRKITNQLLHQAQTSPQAEICGLIGSINNQPVHCYPVTNIAELPDKQFLLEPKQQIAAMKKMRDRGETLFAIYHSHPSAPAIPSASDLALAAYPDALNFIISLNTKGVLQIRGYRIDAGNAVEVELRLSQG